MKELGVYPDWKEYYKFHNELQERFEKNQRLIKKLLAESRSGNYD